MYKCAVCLIIKNESQYLEEWLNHYRNLGFDHFFIYDNNSDYSVENYLESWKYEHADTTSIKWEDEAIASQQRAYLDCCRKNQHYDYILFVDTDEFLVLNSGWKSINDYLDYKTWEFGKFDGLAISWRFYGENFETRHSVEDYKHYHENGHYKSLVSPRKVLQWSDPHVAKLGYKSVYIDENKEIFTGPIGQHSSKEIYIKHIYCRSLEEWKEKMTRGSGDHVKRERKLEDWYEYNKRCNLEE